MEFSIDETNPVERHAAEKVNSQCHRPPDDLVVILPLRQHDRDVLYYELNSANAQNWMEDAKVYSTVGLEKAESISTQRRRPHGIHITMPGSAHTTLLSRQTIQHACRLPSQPMTCTGRELAFAIRRFGSRQPFPAGPRVCVVRGRSSLTTELRFEIGCILIYIPSV